MSTKKQPFPWRVVGVSAALFVVLAALGWLIFGGGTEPSGVPGADGAPADAATSPADPMEAVDPDAPAQPGGQAAATTASLAAGRAAAGTMELHLFLIVPGLERLVPVAQTVSAPPTLDAQVRAAVLALISWDGVDTTSPVSPDTRLREAWVSPAGIAYLDFYRGFYDFGGGGSLGELHAVYGVVATVTQSFPEVTAVQFLAEGEQVDALSGNVELSGHVDLSRPLRPSSEWVLLEAPRRQPMQPSNDRP